MLLLQVVAWGVWGGGGCAGARAHKCLRGDGWNSLIKYVSGSLKVKSVESIAADGRGNLFLTQQNNHAIYKVTIVENECVCLQLAGQEAAHGFKDSSPLMRVKHALPGAKDSET